MWKPKKAERFQYKDGIEKKTITGYHVENGQRRIKAVDLAHSLRLARQLNAAELSGKNFDDIEDQEIQGFALDPMS